MIGGFSGEDLKLLARVTVRLQVSDYNFKLITAKLQRTAHTPITFVEIVIITIKG